LIRFPKALTAILCGASLAAAGFILQQLFRNRLAGPYIMGISSGSSLLVAITMMGSSFLPGFLQTAGTHFSGFLGAFLVLMLMMAVSKRYGSGTLILLFGVILGQLAASLHSILSYLAHPGELKSFAIWSMGSFSQVMESDFLIFILSLSAGIILAHVNMKDLSILSLGNDTAESMGVNIHQVRNVLLVATGIMTGVSTTFCGPVAFIGLVIPNVSRMLYPSPDFKRLLYINLLLGASMALISDIISSAMIFGVHLPVNITTSLTGAPFVIYILFKKYKQNA